MNVPAELFRIDRLAQFIGVFVILFTVLTLLYSVESMRGRRGLARYYICVLLTCATSLGVVFADNLILFMAFWGFLGLLLYLLIDVARTDAAAYTAKKALIIIGGTDAFMLLGLAIVWRLAERPNLLALSISTLRLDLDTRAAVIAYLCLAAGALAKAGAMPFHTWVPDTAENAPVTVTAFLPASLDKLLGIYLLVRLSVDMFQMTAAMNTVLMAIGSITIIAAVMMALIQHDLKRLLGYHAVSQVGYMVLGIGTGNPVGIAGGLFHMLNHAIYKSCLFLSGGAAEKECGTGELSRMGALARAMPVTFVTFLIGSFAISGVPPLNGFASKWMIYQGVIATGAEGNGLWVIWLIAAMFGSALTLASFMKLVHAVFLGVPAVESRERIQTAREAKPAITLPGGILATLCVLFGLFAYGIPLRFFILPSLGMDVTYSGDWSPFLAFVLILVGLAVGVLIYFLGTGTKTRTAAPFVGGETVVEHEAMRVSGVDFYRTVQDLRFLRPTYRLAEKKRFDVYDIGRECTFLFSRALSAVHNGVLPRYLAWCLLGMLILLYVLSR